MVMAMKETSYAIIAATLSVCALALAILANVLPWWTAENDANIVHKVDVYSLWTQHDTVLVNKNLDQAWYDTWSNDIRALRALSILAAVFPFLAMGVLMLARMRKSLWAFRLGFLFATLATVTGASALIVAFFFHCASACNMKLKGAGFIALLLSAWLSLLAALVALVGACSAQKSRGVVEKPLDEGVADGAEVIVVEPVKDKVVDDNNVPVAVNEEVVVVEPEEVVVEEAVTDQAVAADSAVDDDPEPVEAPEPVESQGGEGVPTVETEYAAKNQCGFNCLSN